MPKIPIHLLDAHKERRKLIKELRSIGPFIRGSVVELRRSCGKKRIAGAARVKVCTRQIIFP